MLRLWIAAGSPGNIECTVLYMSLARISQVNKSVDSEYAALLLGCTFQFEVPIRIEVLIDKIGHQIRLLRSRKMIKYISQFRIG